MVDPTKVFISYAREDFDSAVEIYESLEQLGFQPWMDKKNLMGGEDWDRAITLAVRKADFFLFCASSRSVNKRGAVQREIRLALEMWREKLDDDIYFLPVRLEECEMPDSIRRFQWIDYFGPNSLGSIRSSIVSGLERRKTADVTAPVRVVTRTLRGEKKEQWSVSFAYPEFLPAHAVGI